MKDTIITQIKNIEKSLVDVSPERVIKLISSRQGSLFFAGVGKNSHVASITASTFSSIGIRSFCMDPVDAVHGDMGNITEKDIVVAISKSGNTEELIVFLKNLKKTKPSTKVIAIHSNKKADVKKYASEDLFINIQIEIDEDNIVPTSSLVSYILILQNIGYYIAKKEGYRLADFKNNHPGGSIGKLLRGEIV